MTTAEFKNLKPGDKVMFQKAGGNDINGKIVEVAYIYDEKQVAVPHPRYNNELYVFPYRSLKLVK